MEIVRIPPPADLGDPVASAGAPSHYNIDQAAALLGVSRVSLGRLIRDGRLPVSKWGHRTIRVMPDDLDPFLARSRSHRTVSLDDGGATTEAPAEDGTAVPRAPRSDWWTIGETDHLVQFYEKDAFLLDAVSDYIGTALRAGDVGIVVATPAHQADLADRLVAAGLDVAQASATDRYVTLDAAATLARLMVDGTPDPVRFSDVIGGFIARAATGGRRVRVFGEMVAILVADGNVTAALRLEELWNALQKVHTFALFCGYPLDRLGDTGRDVLVEDVCAAHSRIIPAESYTALDDSDDRLRAIAVLQQKAQSLEAEIAKRTRVEEELRQKEAELQQLLRTRDAFLSAAAHDLRTPLASIKGRAQLLRRRLARAGTVDVPQVIEALTSIDASTTRMAGLIYELLDTARIQLGQPLELHQQETDLVALVNRVIVEFQQPTDRHRLHREMGVPALLGVWDTERLERVLDNLLENAIKYSPTGGDIFVTVDRESDLQGHWAVVAVRDEGVGIPAQDLPRVFERFYRGANVAGCIEGTGIGLTGAQLIVESHGGTLTVASTEGAGSTFTLRLPLESEGSGAAHSRD